MKNRDICIIGTDGTGKSTVCQMLYERLREQEKVSIRYMGGYGFMTTAAKKYFKGGKTTVWQKVTNFFILYHENLYRFFFREEGERLIFDRFVWENFLTENTKRNKVYQMAYSFFPKPKYCFYLTCEEKISFQRKNDIVTEEEKQLLHSNKVRYDSYYKNKKWITVIDTGYQTAEKTLNAIMEVIE